MKLEETLNGGYGGLYGEVVTSDCYRIRSLDFVPDVIYDVGANIGVFARFAREVFPKARIICLEPDPQNCNVFRRFTRDINTILVQKALGTGQLYHPTTARNGSGEVYVSAGLGYPKAKMEQGAEEGMFQTPQIGAVRLSKFVRTYEAAPGSKTLLKLDCEGGENTIWNYPADMFTFLTFDYICAEIHFYAHTGAELQEVREATNEAIRLLSITHDVKHDNVHLWARKKRI